MPLLHVSVTWPCTLHMRSMPLCEDLANQPSHGFLYKAQYMLQWKQCLKPADLPSHRPLLLL